MQPAQHSARKPQTYGYTRPYDSAFEHKRPDTEKCDLSEIVSTTDEINPRHPRLWLFLMAGVVDLKGA